MSVTFSKILAAVAAAVFISLAFKERHLANRNEVRDKYFKPRSRRIIRIFGAYINVLAAWYCFSSTSPARSPWFASEIVGVVAALGGALLRIWAVNTLGRLFTFEVSIRDGHSLVQTGPYRLLMHPSYAGAIQSIAGFSWLIGGPSSFLRSWKWWFATVPLGIYIVGEFYWVFGD